jgi:hypothetical protein
MWTEDHFYWVAMGGTMPPNNQNNNALKVAMQTKSNRTNKCF